jgi:hypothetical protein
LVTIRNGRGDVAVQWEWRAAMAVGKFMKTGGIAALAAGLVLVATPASAQERGRWWQGRGGDTAQTNTGGGDRGNGGERRGGWRGNDNGGGRAARQQQAAPAPQAQAPVQQQQQRNWSRSDRDGGARWGGRDGGDGNRWRDRNQGQVQVQPAPQQQFRNEGRPAWQGRNDGVRDRGDANRWRNDNNVRRDNHPAWRGDRQGFTGSRDRGGNWSRDWRRDNRYDWRSYRSGNRNVYRLSPYYSPYRNYSYRRLYAGSLLDTLFFGSRYWINDPWQYRLPPADGPYRWVRYYDDALLVDIYSGEVVDTIYDFFW